VTGRNARSSRASVDPAASTDRSGHRSGPAAATRAAPRNTHATPVWREIDSRAYW
jgi:hypothetical protein